MCLIIISKLFGHIGMLKSSSISLSNLRDFQMGSLGILWEVQVTARAVTGGCHTISCFLISDPSRACLRSPVVKDQLPASIQISQ